MNSDKPTFSLAYLKEKSSEFNLSIGMSHLVKGWTTLECNTSCESSPLEPKDDEVQPFIMVSNPAMAMVSPTSTSIWKPLI